MTQRLDPISVETRPSPAPPRSGHAAGASLGGGGHGIRPMGELVPALPLKKLLAGVWRGRVTIAILTVVCGLIASVFAILQPNQYRSGGSFMFRRGGEELAIAPLMQQDEPQFNPLLPTNTQHILMSEEVARRVVDRVGAKRILAPFVPRVPTHEQGTMVGTVRGWVYALQRWIHAGEPTGEPSPVGAAQALLSRLTVDSPYKSTLLNVRYVAHDPKSAQEILDVYMDEAVKRHLEVYSDLSGIRLVEKTYEETQKRLGEAEGDFAEFLASLGIIGVEFESELAARRETWLEARAALSTLRGRIGSNKRLLANLNDRLQKLEPHVKRKRIESVANPKIEILNRQIANRELTVQELFVRLAPTDQAILNAEQAIERLRDKLQEAERNPVLTREVEEMVENKDYRYLEDRIDEESLELAIDEDSIATTEAALGTARTAYEEYSKHQKEYVRRRSELERVGYEFEQAEKALANARAKQVLTSNEVSSLTVLSQPTLPLSNEGTRRSRTALLGLLGGLALGLGYCFVRTLLDRTVRTIEDLEEVSFVPVLASMPNANRKHVHRHIKKRGFLP